jgi:hypothetical protein
MGPAVDRGNCIHGSGTAGTWGGKAMERGSKDPRLDYVLDGRRMVVEILERLRSEDPPSEPSRKEIARQEKNLKTYERLIRQYSAPAMP